MLVELIAVIGRAAAAAAAALAANNMQIIMLTDSTLVGVCTCLQVWHNLVITAVQKLSVLVGHESLSGVLNQCMVVMPIVGRGPATGTTRHYGMCQLQLSMPCQWAACPCNLWNAFAGFGVGTAASCSDAAHGPGQICRAAYDHVGSTEQLAALPVQQLLLYCFYAGARI
jgi:hypothetical protein